MTGLRNCYEFERLTRDGRCGGCGAIVPLYVGDAPTEFQSDDVLSLAICGVHVRPGRGDGRAWCVVRMEYTTVEDGWSDPHTRKS